MLRRAFIGNKDALSAVFSLILALAITVPTIGTIFMYGVPVINDLNEKKDTEKGKNALGSVSDEIRSLTNSGFKDSTTVNLDLPKDSSISVDQGTDRTVLMYSTDPGYSFTVSNFDNDNSLFYIYMENGQITKANFYLVDPTKETCFLAGTKILMADGSYKNIEDVRVGDSVKSYDEKSEKLTDGIVTHAFSHTPDEMGDYYLVINNQLCVTPNHRFYSNGKWVYADDLKIGDLLFAGYDEDYVVYSVDKVFDKVPTFDLEIENCHTYFVSLDYDKVDVLVHNGGSSSLTFDSPKEGEQWPLDSNKVISWTYSGTSEQGIISLVNNAIHYNQQIGVCNLINGPGAFPWVVAASELIDGYQILIEGKISGAKYFSNLFSIIPPNQPPNKPTITGPLTGKTGSAYVYKFSTTDPENDNVLYYIDWGNGNSGWLGPYPSGVLESASHSWGFPSPYTVKVQAKDTNGVTSPWSDPLTVTINNNVQPTNPTITGTDVCQYGTSYVWTLRSTDDGTQVYYYINWGDGTNSGWLGPYASGISIDFSHTYNSVGTKTIQAKARDVPENAESGITPYTINVRPATATVSGPATGVINTPYPFTVTSAGSTEFRFQFEGTWTLWSSTSNQYTYPGWTTTGTKTITGQGRAGLFESDTGSTTISIGQLPTVSINDLTSPVSGIVTITGTSGPEGSIQNVQISFDQKITWIDVNPNPTWSSWIYQWDTTGLEGSYTIFAHSYDGVHYAEYSVDVIVQNAAPGQGTERQDENQKISHGDYTCSIEGSNPYTIYLPTGNIIHGTGVIDLYDTVDGSDYYFGSIWFFVSNSMTYASSDDQLSSLIIENGLIIDKNENSATIRNMPNVIYNNGVLSLSIYQLVESSRSGTSSIGGNSRINLKSYGSGMSVRDRLNKVYDFKMQFYGDNRNSWINYLTDNNNYLNFESTTAHGVESIKYKNFPVTLVLWHTYIEFGINI